MFLDKKKIKKNKFLFFLLSFGVFIGIILLAQVVVMFTETTKVTAVVVNEYRTGSSVNHTPYGSKIDVEWEDEDGDIHTEGNLANEEGLSIGDEIQITVDADTQSRRILDYKGIIVLTLTGLGFILYFGWGVFCTFGKDKEEDKEKDKEKNKTVEGENV